MVSDDKYASPYYGLIPPRSDDTLGHQLPSGGLCEGWQLWSCYIKQTMHGRALHIRRNGRKPKMYRWRRNHALPQVSKANSTTMLILVLCPVVLTQKNRQLRVSRDSESIVISTIDRLDILIESPSDPTLITPQHVLGWPAYRPNMKHPAQYHNGSILVLTYVSKLTGLSGIKGRLKCLYNISNPRCLKRWFLKCS